MHNSKLKKNLVSIGILCFNAEETILEAINSAFQQSWNNKEIIVVDDCSSDNSHEKIINSRFFKNIKYFKNDNNMGPAYSRNKVLNLSDGEFICFMDDDDFSEKFRIKEQIESIYRAGYPQNNDVISICGIKRVYPTGYTKKLNPIGSKGLIPSGKQYINFILFNEKIKDVDYGFGAPTCAMLLTRSCFKKSGLFDEELRRVEDLDITLRFAMSNHVFIGINKYLVIQKSTYGKDKSPIMNLKSELKVINKYKDYLSQKGLFFYSKLWPYLRYYYFRRNYLFLLLILIILIIKYPIRAPVHFLKSSKNRIIHEYKIYIGG